TRRAASVTAYCEADPVPASPVTSTVSSDVVGNGNLVTVSARATPGTSKAPAAAAPTSALRLLNSVITDLRWTMAESCYAQRPGSSTRRVDLVSCPSQDGPPVTREVSCRSRHPTPPRY